MASVMNQEELEARQAEIRLRLAIVRRRLGGVRALSSISSYLNFPLHVWMLGLGILLLVLRPGNRDARLSSLALVYWAGSLFIYNESGFGVVLQAMPPAVAALAIGIDAIFAAGFFAVAAHFAIVFPSERVGRVHPVWEIAPYVLSLPIFVETLANNLQRLRGDVRPVAMPFNAYALFGTLLLIVALATLGVRLARLRDANARPKVGLRVDVENVANQPYVIARESQFSPSQYSHGRLLSITLRLRF